MLRTLLTPLVARFDLSPRFEEAPLPAEDDGELDPEDFARDVMIELMRNTLENLKDADTLREKTEVLTEIQKIMLQDARTKEVFRELDGFIMLMSVLSTLRVAQEGPIHEPEEQILLEVLESIRLVFMIVSDAIHDYPENAEYFKESVGFKSLSLAIRDLVSDKRTVDVTLGFLLSMSLNDFALSGLFTSLRGLSMDQVDTKIQEFESRLIIIRQPDAIRLLWDSAPRLVDGSPVMRYAIYKLFELLCASCHRNHATLSTMGLVESLLSQYFQLRDDKNASDKERQVAQRLLRRLLELGAYTDEARRLFQRTINAEDQTLDLETLEIVRAAMKSRWLEHFSLESPAELCMEHTGTRGVPSTGFTFAIWLWIEVLPKSTSHPIFTVRVNKNLIVALSVRPDGKLELRTSGNKTNAVFNKSSIPKMRWCHITLVHHAHRSSQPSIRLFMDGVMNDSLTWAYPKSLFSATSTEYVLGSEDADAQMSWCIATAYFVSLPIGNFQDPSLIKFLTYEASTSLNMFLTAVASKGSAVESLSLMKAVRDGLGLSNSAIVFSLSCLNLKQSGSVSNIPMSTSSREFNVRGDVLVVKAACLDSSLWKIGGTSIPLHLLQLAKSPHEISRTLSILTDCIRNSWENSEDMERLLSIIIHFFDTQLNRFRQSTVVNVVAYKAIALDFEFWSHARREIQHVYFEHFITLLEVSRYKAFNMRQRLSKLGLVRRFLFVLQTEWFDSGSVTHVMTALRAATQANFSKDDTIKPIVSYIAANIYEANSASSPHSIISRIDYSNAPQKAEQVLEIFVSLLSNLNFYNKFITALPVTRICLLLIGDRPQPFVATQVLRIIAISIRISASFTRKFELISGWSVLKTVLPECWDSAVNEAAFDVLLGRTPKSGKSRMDSENAVICPQIVPTILSALQTGLRSVGDNCGVSDEGADDAPHFSWVTETTMERLVEDLLDLHASSATFKQTFRSQQTTRLFIESYRAFVTKLLQAPLVNQRTLRLLEKIAHLGISLAVDSAVAGAQKREIQAILQDAETLLNPSAEKTVISAELLADTRTVRERFASARFSIQVSERTVIKIFTRMVEWRKTIQTSEKKRLRKNMLDLREHRRQISRLYEWSHALTSERGIWPDGQPRLWRLDETEGPHRIRNKLEPETQRPSTNRVDVSIGHIRDVSIPEADNSSALHVEVPPWSESYEISATDVEERQLAEDIKEDKHRRVRHELEAGDVIEAIGTVARISGVDSSPGLLIIGRTHLYMLDGLVEDDDGEVIDAHDAPKRLLFVPGSIVELDGPQKAQRWAHAQVDTHSRKTFLFRDVALEIYFKDSRSLLIVFLDKKKRLDVDQRLTAMVNSANAPPTPGLLRTPLLGMVGAMVLSGFREDELATAQRKWQAREISNFTYLSILNQISGRTPSDATQYPVFPFATLRYTNTEHYSSLSRPMGALTEARREAATVRYESLQSVEEKPFHYGTHFSSSMIVCHFLIRLAPFTNMFKTLQGGDWDLPDRLFSNIARAYDSAARDIRGDVRELIPEFYTCPEFLENTRNLDFGVQQSSGEKIHDVKLPPWAKQDPLLFITLNRKALESSFVSEHLAQWIDLIWGCKQRDAEALNCFHPLSYEGSIDLDSITDELEREATVGIIHNFGQTPRKLFDSPHPQRFNHGCNTLPLGTLHGIPEDAHLLVQGSRCFKDLGLSVAVRELVLDMIGERVIPCRAGVLSMPSRPHEQVEWSADGISGGELRVSVDQKIAQVIEGTSCRCATFADSNCLVTGSNDFTVRIWKISRGTSVHLSLSHMMRMHEGPVITVASSRSWSIIVSGSEDGSAALWDLNRGVYVRSIWHAPEGGKPSAVGLVAINESTGYIATCSHSRLFLHTINGRCITSLDITQSASLQPSIISLAFHEREYSEMGVLATGGSDGSIVLRTWTADGTEANEEARWEFVTIRSMKVRAIAGRSPAVTALKFLGESLCHGEETGKSFMWSLPD
ncbi:beach-domain-containing protein [Hymenopellis radicata]|nr:beach-domain-containing protein [Hymenopellis radicata]